MLIEPMLCEFGDPERLGDFRGPGWTIETKYDGERIIAQIEGGRTHLWTRREIDVHDKFPEIEEALKALPIKGHTIIDGELIVGGGFGSLGQRQTGDKLAIRILSRKMPATYMVFDILILNRENLMPKPLRERRKSLDALLEQSSSSLRRAPEFPPESAKEIFDRIVSKGGEGVIAKRLDSAYESGKRSRNWVKFKRIRILDVDIIGATRSDAGLPFASLMMMREGRFFGNVGSGFKAEDRGRIMEMLVRNRADEPATDIPRGVEVAVLSKPLPAEVKVSEINEDGMPRAPVWIRFKSVH